MSPEYRALILGERTAWKVVTLAPKIPGYLRSPEWAWHNLAWRDEGTRREYMNVFMARQGVIERRRAAGEMALSTIIGKNALNACGAYAQSQAERLLKAHKKAGCDIFMVDDQLLQEALAELPLPTIEAHALMSTVALSSTDQDPAIVYGEYTPTQGPHETWVPSAEVFMRHNEVAEALTREALDPEHMVDLLTT